MFSNFTNFIYFPKLQLCFYIIFILAGFSSSAQKKIKSNSSRAGYVNQTQVRKPVIRYVASLNKKTDIISASELRVLEEILCHVDNPEYTCGQCAVKSYSMKIISHDNVIFSENSNSRYFSEDALKYFASVKNGDLIVIYNILVQNTIGTERAQSTVYEIAD